MLYGLGQLQICSSASRSQRNICTLYEPLVALRAMQNTTIAKGHVVCVAVSGGKAMTNGTWTVERVSEIIHDVVQFLSFKNDEKKE